MELKRIIARDSRAANDKAIQLYGPDVLVISSQRVDSQTELIVAIDTEAAAGSNAQIEGESVSAQAAEASSDARSEARSQAFSEIFKVNAEQPAQPEPEPEDAPQWQPAALKLAQAGRSSAASQREDAAAPALVSASALASAQDSADLQRSRDTVELLREEIAALRQEFNLSRQVLMWQSGQGLSPELTGWFAQMQELGVPASLRTLMADAAAECTTVSEAWPLIHRTLTHAIERRKASWPLKGVHALVGPSGAGKSLMAARMAQAAASQLPVESMAIISLCDTRPGAWSQLQVLAAQTGVSCYRAGDMAALEVLLQELTHLQLVWIDTPGADFLSHARALLGAPSKVSIHAVLPLDATVTNVRKIFDAADLNWSSAMLTKLDEAAHPWPVLKALCDRPLAVSAVAASHLARTEPRAFDAQALVDLALGGLRPEGMVEQPVPRKTRKRAASTRTKAVHG